MADKKTYTVEALLKATDAGFTKTLKGAAVMMGGLGKGANKTSSVFKSMFGANLASSALVGGLRVAKNGVVSMVSELNSSNIAWKSFEGNMKIMGKSTSEITKAKKEMQDYATQTIYSASDMASTYAQLASVGVKNTGKLVRGFGGLAAAAENPKQAMKTLSQQATQMAAKPQVAWADFKLMMEQSPAGIAAVAKEMGMSTQELVKSVQDGEIKTQDFFDAIERVGTNTSFTKMATDFKSVGQAIDGMKEGLANKLQPAFEEFNKFGIDVFKGLAAQLDKVNFDKLATSVRNALNDVKKFFAILGGTGAFSALKSMLDSIGKAIGHVFGSLSGKGDEVTNVAIKIGDAFVVVSGHVEKFANWIAKIDPSTIKSVATTVLSLVVGFKALQVGIVIGQKLGTAFKVVKGALNFGTSLIKLVAQMLGLATAQTTAAASSAGLAAGETAVGTAASASVGSILAMGAAVMMIGAGVVLAAGGIYILVQAAIQLGQAGLGAGIAMAGLVLSITGLAALFAFLGPVLTASAIGLLAFGATVLMVSAGVSLIIAAISTLMPYIPQLSSAFNSAAIAIGTVMTMIVSAVSQGIATIVNSFSKLLTSISTVLTSVSTVIQSFGTAVKTILDGIAKVFTSMGTAALNAGKGTLKVAEGISTLVALPMGDLAGTLGAVAGGLGKIAGHADGLSTAGNATKTLASGLQRVATNGNSAVSALSSLPSAATSIGTAFTSAASTVKSAMNSMVNAVKSGGNTMKTQAKTIGTQTGQNLASGIRSQVGAVNSAVGTLTNAAASRGRAGAAAMRSAGSYIGQGLAQGMRQALGEVTAAANALVAQAERAARAKAQIHSPSRLFRDNVGIYIGQGVAVGIERSQKYVDEAMSGIFDTINSFDFASTGLFDSNLALDMGTVSANISTDSTNQNRLMAKLADKMEQVANRDIVMNINGREFARATGDDINSYTANQQTVLKRLRGEI